MMCFIKILKKMKKSILLICLISLAVSCKKKENTSSSSTGTTGGGGSGLTNDTYAVLIESNFSRSTMSVENITDQTIMKRYNTLTSGTFDSVKTCPIAYTFTGLSNKKYRVYTYSTKKAGDTTLYMTDTGLTWNYLRVKKNGTVIYDHKDTVGYGGSSGSQRITSNECKINY